MESNSLEYDHSLLEADDFIEDNKSLNGSAFGKSRKPNWTSHEIRALMEGYARNRGLLRSRGVYKGTGERAVNNAKRQRIWEGIAMAVNKSRPDFAGQGPQQYTTGCVRTVKEVVKKWVNLVNRMKSDIAIKKSNRGYELGATTRAVYTIVSTDEPLQFRGSPGTGDQSDDMTVKVEPAEYSNDDSMISTEENHLDYNPATNFDQDDNDDCTITTSRPSFVQSNVKAAILKRHFQQNGGGEDPDIDARPSSAKKQAYTLENITDTNNREQSREHYADYEALGANDYATEETDENLKATYKLNKDIMELQKRKLEVEVERMLVEKEKAVIEKEQMLIEKEMTLLRKEKLQLEVEQFRKTLNAKTE